jgi:cobalt-precorrin-5B (C1)-methyltransferase
VTLPGLPVAVGRRPSTPRPMAQIRAAAAEALPLPPVGGVRVVVDVEDGGNLARRTMNPRLGIVGRGLHPGTSGIVRPSATRPGRRHRRGPGRGPGHGVFPGRPGHGAAQREGRRAG